MGIENVPQPPGIAKPKQLGGTLFPAMLWNRETGENKIFNAAGDVPEGWLNHHPKDPDPTKSDPKLATILMSRQEVVDALKNGGIPFAKNAPHAQLYDLLLIGVKDALTESKIAFDSASTDAKALLGLFPAS